MLQPVLIMSFRALPHYARPLAIQKKMYLTSVGQLCCRMPKKVNFEWHCSDCVDESDSDKEDASNVNGASQEVRSNLPLAVLCWTGIIVHQHSLKFRKTANL